MKVLSLYQPWATLVVFGAKSVETRSWATRYRGPLLIHASQKFGKEQSDLCAQEPFASALRAADSAPILPAGQILGRVDVIDYFPTANVRVETTGSVIEILGGDSALQRKLLINPVEAAFGDYTPRRFAWLLANPVRFITGIPCRGAMGFWTPPAEVQANVTAALEECSP